MDRDLLDKLKELLADKSLPVDDRWVDDMAAACPYFTLPAAMQLERTPGLSEERRHMLMQRVALGSACPDMLYRLTEPLGALQSDFYPPANDKPAPTTDEAISMFIDNYGGSDDREEAILERLIFNPTPDYAQILAEEEERSLPSADEAGAGDQDSLINAFILKSRDNNGRFPMAEEEDAAPAQAEEVREESIQPPVQQDESLLSESLAKIYIKQHRYSKAFEIISNLSLKYPEKSIYFADQLRFLQKLIINQQYLKQK